MVTCRAVDGLFYVATGEKKPSLLGSCRFIGLLRVIRKDLPFPWLHLLGRNYNTSRHIQRLFTRELTVYYLLQNYQLAR